MSLGGGAGGESLRGSRSGDGVRGVRVGGGDGGGVGSVHGGGDSVRGGMSAVQLASVQALLHQSALLAAVPVQGLLALTEPILYF